MKEKYEVPKPGDLDKIRETKNSLLGLVPGGSLVNQLVDTFFTSPIEKRREEWMSEVAEGLQRLESEFDILQSKLVDNEEFLDILYTATAASIRTSSQAKRFYLRNFVLNSALRPNLDESYRKSLLSKLERVEEAHVVIMLEVETKRERIRPNESEKDKFRCFASDLRFIGVDVTGPDVESDGIGITGRDLLSFIVEPFEQD